jgi:plasmid stabilization system protein ParE
MLQDVYSPRVTAAMTAHAMLKCGDDIDAAAAMLLCARSGSVCYRLLKLRKRLVHVQSAIARLYALRSQANVWRVCGAARCHQRAEREMSCVSPRLSVHRADI